MDKFEDIQTNIEPCREWYRVKCQACGQFISQIAIITGKAKHHFIPDSVCGPEENYWECERCK